MFENILISDEDITRVETEVKLTFDENRKDILKALNSIDVQACPGSGKTTLIAAKLILLAKKWDSTSQGICVLSHTNVAKDEIIDRLRKSGQEEATKLLSYPHFIGTIQEFVNKFLGLPLIRSMGIDVKQIDDNACVEALYRNLNYVAKRYIELKNINGGNVLFNFPLKIMNCNIVSIVPTFGQDSKAATFFELKRVRDQLINRGCFFYRDMYIYANKALNDTDSLQLKVRKRFPLVLLDEMQDTQKYQDVLLFRIFSDGANPSSVQRFGDPDQAIFSGGDGDEPNETYNSKPIDQMFKIINNSNRFLDSIAMKVRGLSKNKVSLSTNVSGQREIEYQDSHRGIGDFRHSIFVYDDETILNVLPSFAELVEGEFSDKELLTLKALGANGSEASQFTISNYFPSYKKNKAPRKFKSFSLIESFYFVRENKCGNIYDGLKVVHQAVLEMLKRLNSNLIQDGIITFEQLQDFLEKEKKYSEYRRILFKIINNDEELNETSWRAYVVELMSVLDLRGADAFLDFNPRTRIESEFASESNVFIHHNLKIEVGTIHGVKGETHNATLILETKNRQFDISGLLPWIIDETKALPDQVTKIKFMKLLYVAMTRPRHLLCFAIHRNRISDDQITSLELMSWNIKNLTTNHSAA